MAWGGDPFEVHWQCPVLFLGPAGDREVWLWPCGRESGHEGEHASVVEDADGMDRVRRREWGRVR